MRDGYIEIRNLSLKDVSSYELFTNLAIKEEMLFSVSKGTPKVSYTSLKNNYIKAFALMKEFIQFGVTTSTNILATLHKALSGGLSSLSSDRQWFKDNMRQQEYANYCPVAQIEKSLNTLFNYDKYKGKKLDSYEAILEASQILLWVRQIKPFEDFSEEISRLACNYLLLSNNHLPIIFKVNMWEDFDRLIKEVLETEYSHNYLNYFMGACVGTFNTLKNLHG